AGGALGGGPSGKGSKSSAPEGCNATPGTATRPGMDSSSAEAGVEKRERSVPRISVEVVARMANIVPSADVERSEAESLAEETVKASGAAAVHWATGPPGAVPKAT